MIGRVYVNEIGPDAALLEFSMWPGQVLDERHHYGFAYLKTLEHLGIRHEIFPTGHGMFMEGTVADAKQHLPTLNRHIGLIARYGADLDRSESARQWRREYIGKMLGRLTQATLPELPDDAGITRLAAAITKPFAEAANNENEAFRMIFNQIPWWSNADGYQYKVEHWRSRIGQADTTPVGQA